MDTIIYLNQVSNFLDQLYNEVKIVGIDVSNLNIDHIAYTTSSSESAQSEFYYTSEPDKNNIQYFRMILDTVKF